MKAAIRKIFYKVKGWRICRHLSNNRYIYLTLLCICLPIYLYWHNFGQYGLSKSTDNWGTFGDYIGGCCSIIIAVMALIITRKMDKKERRDKKVEEAVVNLFTQINKITTNDYDARHVNKLLRDAHKYRLVLSEDLYSSLIKLCDYFLRVKDGDIDVNPSREEEVLLRLKSLYNG